MQSFKYKSNIKMWLYTDATCRCFIFFSQQCNFDHVRKYGNSERLPKQKALIRPLFNICMTPNVVCHKEQLKGRKREKERENEVRQVSPVGLVSWYCHSELPLPVSPVMFSCPYKATQDQFCDAIGRLKPCPLLNTYTKATHTPDQSRHTFSGLAHKTALTS